jgi:hypothetical protein
MKLDRDLLVSLFLDAIDLIPLSWFPIAGEIIDFIQTGLGAIFYKDKSLAIMGGSDLLLPAGFDLVPTFTISYLIKKSSNKK